MAKETIAVPQAVELCHQALAWLIPVIEKFPRHRRFTLGERIERELLDVLAALIEAAYSRDKQSPLTRANLRLSVARHLWRLAHELKALPTRQYEHGSALLVALGQQTGGWLKSSRQ